MSQKKILVVVLGAKDHPTALIYDLSGAGPSA